MDNTFLVINFLQDFGPPQIWFKKCIKHTVVMGSKQIVQDWVEQ